MNRDREIKKILIANRGVTAVRIMHTCRDRKIPTTAVYSTPDRLAHHVFMTDSAVHIGEAPPSESYLNMGKMIAAAIQSRSDAIHPGWGFLSGRYHSASEVIRAGLRLLEQEEKKVEAIRSALELGEKSGIARDFNSKNHLKSLHTKQM